LLDLQLALAAKPGLLGCFLLYAFALARFGLCPYRIGFGQIDVLLALSCRPRRRLAALARRFAGRLGDRALLLARPVLLDLFDDAALEQLIAQGIGHAGFRDR
jgi:hypothetical protein